MKIQYYVPSDGIFHFIKDNNLSEQIIMCGYKRNMKKSDGKWSAYCDCQREY